MIANIEDYPVHNSQRGWFGRALYFEMAKHPDIFLLTGDLGYGIFDLHQSDFSTRFINCGASEQAMVGISVGLALSGKIPVCYSITPFLLCRPFEWIRNYLEHEKIPVRLVGAGLDDDYKHDGHTHHAFDAVKIMELFPSIRKFCTTSKEQVPPVLSTMIAENSPSLLILRR